VEHGASWTSLEICEVRLFVKAGGLKPEGVDHVVDLDSAVLQGFLLLFGGGIGT
jgi:hypothetical protein